MLLVVLFMAVAIQLQLVGEASSFPLNLVHVRFHKQHALNQILEVRGHRVQEFLQRSLDFLHFALQARDAILELLAHERVTLVRLADSRDLLGCDVGGRLGLQVDVVVARALVHDLNVRVLVLHNLVLDSAVVAIL